MKTMILKSISAAFIVTLIAAANLNAQGSASTGTEPAPKHQFVTGAHGGMISPANFDYKFEMVYRENDKKIDIYFINPEGSLIEAGGLTGEITFVNEDKSTSVVNASYQNKKFTAGVPDGKPLYMCGIVLSYDGQMYGGRFVNPSLVK